MFSSVLMVIFVLVKTGIYPPRLRQLILISSPKHFPYEETSVNPSLCPVQSLPPKGSVCSPTVLQHPRTCTSANNASPQITLLGFPAAETPNCRALKFANPDLCAWLNPGSLLGLFRALPPAISVVKSEWRKVVVTPQVFKE